VIFLHRKRLKRKAGITITEKALTIRSKKQKKGYLNLDIST